MNKLILSALISLLHVSQNLLIGQPILTGHWEGTITREGKDWKCWLNVSPEGDSLTGKVDLPDYGLYAVQLEKIQLIDSSVVLELADQSGPVRFSGKLADTEMTGRWEGIGVDAVFHLRRICARSDFFIEEEFRFQNGDAALAGTLVKPPGPGPHPAIVFTHGSGNQTRTQRFYRSRAYLFARHGIAALIYDRRGRGSSAGGGDDATWINLADDAIAGVRALMARPDINPKQIGVSGFSQGGWVSPLAAVRSEEIAFVLVGSAPGVTPEEQNDFNVEAVLGEKKVRKVTIDSVMSLRNRIGEYQHSGNGDTTELKAAIAVFRKEPWFRNALLPESEIVPYDKDSKEYITFDPGPSWEAVRVPVFAAWGSHDAAVPAEKSRTIIENALRKGGNKDYTMKIFPQSGHGVSLLKNVNEWDWPRLAPGYQELMIEWLSERVNIRR